jgi:hypothetical protein
MGLEFLFFDLRDVFLEYGRLIVALLLAGLLPGGIAIVKRNRFKWIILALGCLLVVVGFLPWIAALVWAMWPKAGPLPGRGRGWPVLSPVRDFGEPALAGAPGGTPALAPTASPTARPASAPAEFEGDRSLANDAYRLFLLRKYRPRKEEALGVFVVRDRAFTSLDETLAHLAAAEEAAAAPGGPPPGRTEGR